LGVKLTRLERGQGGLDYSASLPKDDIPSPAASLQSRGGVLLRTAKYSQDVLVANAAGAAVVAATVTNFLAYNGYPLIRPEVGVLAAGTLVMTMVMACLYAGQRQWGRSLLEAVLAGLFVDFNITSDANYYVAIAVALGVGAYTFLRSASLLRPMAVIGAVIFVTSAAGLGKPSKWISTAKAKTASPPISNRPKTAILHIILDEHIGIEGIPTNLPDGARLKAELQSFYRANGFVLYGRAYSEYLHTINAVPNVMNYGKQLARSGSRNGVDVGPTVHFQKLADQGYRLKILQSSFAEFCAGTPFADCTTYSASSPTATLYVPLSTGERTQLLLAKMATLTALSRGATSAVRRISKLFRRAGIAQPRLPHHEAGRSSTAGALMAFDALTAELHRAQPGDAYFAHLLAPHFPYIVRADCSYLPWEDWKSRLSRTAVSERQHAYFDQVRCTTAKLKIALNAFRRSSAGPNSVVIVHGDHGSRISRKDANLQNVGTFDESDLLAGFSTLFAVRAPKLTAKYIEEPQPIALLLRDFTTSQFQNAPRPLVGTKHSVMLDDGDWKPQRRYPLPEQW
jgi:hypothetical protein